MQKEFLATLVIIAGGNEAKGKGFKIDTSGSCHKVSRSWDALSSSPCVGLCE